ncbi:MAG: cold-shock protein [Planctomycetota bacterium]
MPYTNQKHETEQIEGAVKWFDPKKGFGFIVGPDGQDVFVHFSQIVVEGFKTLQDDQRVTYELVEGDKGYQAQGVRPVVDPEEAVG